MFGCRRCFVWLAAVIAATLLGTASIARGATIEYLDGTRFECKVLSKDDKNVTVEVVSAGMAVKRTIPLAKVHKVTINDKTYVINERPAGSSGSKVETAADDSVAGDKARRTKAEVDALINELGRKPPEWFDATPLNYPKTLDLSWPLSPPQGPWNAQKNVGQYIWSIINENPSKWREGIRLLHHLLTLHKDDPAKRERDMEALGRMYHNLHQDYARAAFWWRQAGVEKTQSPPAAAVHLAECYWRLGNRQMAAEQLRKMRAVPYDAIKLWADMGEIQQALSIASQATKSPTGQHHFAYLYAADACRVAGRFNEAIGYYEKVLAVPNPDKNKGQITRCQERAQASLEAIKLFQLCDVKKVADGTYRADSIGYEAPIEVEVDVQSGRIDSVRVVRHKEKQFYSAMTDTPAKIIAKQSVKGIDATSSATITSEAIINATAKALASGAK
jgi:uncharacterized protein with FMN-binding domain